MENLLRIPIWRGVRRRLGVLKRRIFPPLSTASDPVPAPPPSETISAISAEPDIAARLAGKNLYFGSLLPTERQYKSGDFVGLALNPKHDREVAHDATAPLPVPDNSVAKIQSQDVFEHIAYEALPAILNDIYRALAPGGTFRLSVPDYRSPLLVKRSVFDENGEVLADVMMGGSVTFDRDTSTRKVGFVPGGEAHVWFPTYEKVRSLIERTDLRRCAAIRFHHYMIDRTAYVAEPIPENGMFVMRAPPHDRRAGGAPISIVVDFVK